MVTLSYNTLYEKSSISVRVWVISIPYASVVDVWCCPGVIRMLSGVQCNLDDKIRI